MNIGVDYPITATVARDGVVHLAVTESLRNEGLHFLQRLDFNDGGGRDGDVWSPTTNRMTGCVCGLRCLSRF